MSRLRDWAVALGVLAAGRRRPRRSGEGVRVVRPGEPALGAESVVIALLLLAGVFAVGFVVVYALDGLPSRTQLFGIALGGCFLLLGAAGIVIGKHLVVAEELVEEYPELEHPAEQEAIAQTLADSGSRFTRKRLLLASGGFAAGALGVAAITPAVSFGPVFDTSPFYESGWYRGRRLVDEQGNPWHADQIEEGDFYTAYPEHGLREELWSPLVVVRLPVDELALPAPRRNWAPGGILAYSKICTHAGCAISLYRKPTFPPVEPRPALVCPCHYSTFDPATGGTVRFGPAGRPLPQLPLLVDAHGYLRAGGNFSGPVGPSWWGVRMGKARTE